MLGLLRGFVRTLALITAAALLPCQGLAQAEHPLIGTRVRLMTEDMETRGEWQVGHVTAVDRHSITLRMRDGDVLNATFRALARIQRSAGRSTERGVGFAAAGFVLGFGTGAGLVLGIAEGDATDGWLLMGLGVGVLGGVVGGLRGFAERWRDVELATTGRAIGGQVDLATLTLPFRGPR